MALSRAGLDRFGAWERESWERSAGAYAASLGILTTGSTEALLDAAGVRAGTRVVDVGTGPGFVGRAAAARGALVVGLDQSTAMTGMARATGQTVVRAGATALPFGDGRLDAVVAGYLLNHLPSAEAAVAEAARVLAPGGRFAFTVWDVPEANPVTGLFGPVVAELGLAANAPDGPDPQRLADEAEVRRLLTRWTDVAVERLRWSVAVAPGAWFDAIAEATPRTGAALAAAGPRMRAAARSRYVALATERYGRPDGTVELPAGAVLSSATRGAAG